MNLVIKKFLRGTDHLLARMYLTFFRESDSLIILLLHSVVKDERDYALNVIDPTLAVTVGDLRRSFEYFLNCGYRFVRPEEVLDGLPEGKYALVTFDDGYFNNNNAVPLLTEYKIPAVVYLSTGHIEDNKCFWWDVLYREAMKSGATPAALSREIRRLKQKSTGEIERYLITNFGGDSLKPVGDIDRPFSPSELAQLSDHKYLSWGNHTREHAVLNNYPADAVREQIEHANSTIREMTGQIPTSIAYPNGSYSDAVISIAREAGLKMGVTTEKRKNRFPIDHRKLMVLGRFSLNNREDICRQCATIRSDINISAAVHNVLREKNRNY